MKITPRFVAEVLSLAAGYTLGEFVSQRKERRSNAGRGPCGEIGHPGTPHVCTLGGVPTQL